MTNPQTEGCENKPVDDEHIVRNELVAWPWVNPSYTARISREAGEISRIEIDPSQRMADVNRENNAVEFEGAFKPYEDPTR